MTAGVGGAAVGGLRCCFRGDGTGLDVRMHEAPSFGGRRFERVENVPHVLERVPSVEPGFG